VPIFAVTVVRQQRQQRSPAVGSGLEAWTGEVWDGVAGEALAAGL
jgi:hypothetical protein